MYLQDCSGVYFICYFSCLSSLGWYSKCVGFELNNFKLCYCAFIDGMLPVFSLVLPCCSLTDDFADASDGENEIWRLIRKKTGEALNCLIP